LFGRQLADIFNQEEEVELHALRSVTHTDIYIPCRDQSQFAELLKL